MKYYEIFKPYISINQFLRELKDMTYYDSNNYYLNIDIKKLLLYIGKAECFEIYNRSADYILYKYLTTYIINIIIVIVFISGNTQAWNIYSKFNLDKFQIKQWNNKTI